MACRQSWPLIFFRPTPKHEIDIVQSACQKTGVEAAISEIWRKGGEGGKNLAKAVVETIKKKPSRFRLLYDGKKPIREKIEIIARQIYGAKGVKFSPKAISEMKKIEKNKLDKVPVCIAKTQYSLSDDPKLLGRPRNFTLNISEIRISNGAGFVVALAGEITTMPGLPKIPAAEKIDVDKNGKISGLF